MTLSQVEIAERAKEWEGYAWMEPHDEAYQILRTYYITDPESTELAWPTGDEMQGEMNAVRNAVRKVHEEETAKVVAHDKAIANELRALTAYPFNPSWKASNKKRYQKCLENINFFATELEAERIIL